MSKQNLPFWNEYPDRDTEFVRVYPTKYEKITAEDIWKKKPGVLSINLLQAKQEDYAQALKKEIKKYTKQPYIKRISIKSIKFKNCIYSQKYKDTVTKILSLLKEVLGIDKDVEILIEFSKIKEKNLEFTSLSQNINGTFAVTQDNFDDVFELCKRDNKINIVFDETNNKDFTNRVYNEILKDKFTNRVSINYSNSEQLESIIKKSETCGYQIIYIDKDVVCFSLSDEITCYEQCSIVENCELIGIGLGESGFIGDWIYKNTSDLQEYLKQVNNDELPYSEGVKLHKKDIFKLYVIENLKYGKVKKEEFERLFGFDIMFLFEKQLNSLKEQGVVQITDTEVQMQLVKTDINQDRKSVV